MKRSEMVELLRAAVQESNGDFGWYELEQANEVLKKLEIAGMLPPPSIKAGGVEWEPELTLCIDCGVETTPGKGSARCPSCWDDKCGR